MITFYIVLNSNDFSDIKLIDTHTITVRQRARVCVRVCVCVCKTKKKPSSLFIRIVAHTLQKDLFFFLNVIPREEWRE